MTNIASLDSLAGVPDVHSQNLLDRVVGDADFDLAPLRRELEGVLDQVDQHLL